MSPPLSSSSLPLDRPEPFQFELRTIFIMTAVIGVCLAIVTLLGWLALPIDGMLLGFVLWTAGNLRGSYRMRREGVTLVALSMLALLGIFLFFGWLVWGVAAGFVAGLIHARRRRLNQRALLWLLATTAQANAPLVPALEAFSRECRSRYGRRVLRLAGLVQRGMSLDQALDELRLLPAEQRLAVRIGLASGQLPSALQEAAHAQASVEPLRQTFELHGLYLWWVLATMGGISLFIAIKVLPEFQKIFREFELEQGMAAFVRQLDISTAEELVTWFVAAVVLLGLAYTLKAVLGWSLFVSRFDTALVLRAMACCTAKGAPIEVALRALADLHPRYCLRRRARRLLTRLTGGVYWLDGLRRCRLIGAAEAGVLRASASANHLPWALRELAASAERRQIYRRQMLLETVLPLAVVFLGVLVFAVVAVCFVPLVEIINVLSARG